MVSLRCVFTLLIAVLLIGTLSVSAQSDQRVTSEDGSFSVLLPDGWFVETKGAIIFLTNREADPRELFNADLEDRESIIQVTVDTPDRLIELFGLEINIDSTPLGFLADLVDQLEQSGLEKEGPVFTRNGDPSKAYSKISGENNQGQIHVIQIGDAYAVVTAVAASNKLEFLQETIEATTKSIIWKGESAFDRESTSLELTEPYTFENELATLLYPKGWFIYPFNEGGLAIGNSERSAHTGQVFYPNDVAISVIAYTLTDWREVAQLGDPVIDTPLQLLQRILELEQLSLHPSMELDGPTELSFNGHAAASLTGTLSDSEQLDIIVIEIAEDVFAMVRLRVDDGELERWQPLSLAIAESITINSEAEATPEAVVATPLPLTESYTSDNSMFALDYPAEWTLENTPGDWHLRVTLFNGETLVPDQIYPPGAASIEVTVTDIDDFVMSVGRESSEITAEDIVRFRWFGLSADQADRVEELIQTLASNSGAERSAIQPITVDGMEAARVDMQIPGFNEGFALAYIDNDIVVEVRLITAIGERDQWSATALAIADAFRYLG